MNYITWTDLAAVVFLILGVVICIYLVALIRNLNESIKAFKIILTSNKDNINTVLKDLPVITGNLTEISETTKSELKVVGEAIKNINETAEMTAATAQTIKDDIVGNVKGVFELMNLVRRIFYRNTGKNKDN